MTTLFNMLDCEVMKSTQSRDEAIQVVPFRVGQHVQTPSGRGVIQSILRNFQVSVVLPGGGRPVDLSANAVSPVCDH